MVARALLVLLLVMNLSVAAWWATHASPVPAARGDAIPAGIPRLRLLSEDGHAPAPGPALRCVRFGPYEDADLLARARERAVEFAGENGAAIATGTVPGTAPERWRVAAPPPQDGDAAALATRIVAAGFDDTVIVAEGPEAGTIALGRFSTPDAAARHQAALREAGFDAQVHAVGGAHDWLRVPVPAGMDAPALRARFAALRADPVPCGD